jgi:hypothetical protein
VPALNHLKSQVWQLYKSKGEEKHFCPPGRRSTVFPLPTNGRNETVTTELKKGLEDILGVLGQTEASYNSRLTFIGGDGLTYERMIQLKTYLQYEETPFRRFEIIQPILQSWHTIWTDLSRCFEAHWDHLLSADPSSLGHSANQIKRKAPANLKKVDYYPNVQLAYVVLDARILDCWR